MFHGTLNIIYNMTRVELIKLCNNCFNRIIIMKLACHLNFVFNTQDTLIYAKKIFNLQQLSNNLTDLHNIYRHACILESDLYNPCWESVDFSNLWNDKKKTFSKHDEIINIQNETCKP